jgi:secondary thiamine-phosphate synthase enzyme
MIKSDHITFSTRGNGDIIDITQPIGEKIRNSGLSAGIVTVFVPGSTGSVTTIEYEPGLVKDLPEFLEKLVSSKKSYHHDKTWNDGNGYAHIRAAMLGPDITIPFASGKLQLGTWQQIVFLEFDNRRRERQLIVQIIGE